MNTALVGCPSGKREHTSHCRANPTPCVTQADIDETAGYRENGVVGLECAGKQHRGLLRGEGLCPSTSSLHSSYSKK